MYSMKLFMILSSIFTIIYSIFVLNPIDTYEKKRERRDGHSKETSGFFDVKEDVKPIPNW
jgi:hypothetical protein